MPLGTLGCPWGSWGAPVRPLEGPRSASGDHWGAPGDPWGAPGGLLRFPEVTLGTPEMALRVPGVPLGIPWAPPESRFRNSSSEIGIRENPGTLWQCSLRCPLRRQW